MSFKGQYLTDVMTEKAYGLLDDAVYLRESQGKPFFLTIAPIAPHANVDHARKNVDGSPSPLMTEPIPAERHKHLVSQCSNLAGLS